MKQLLQACFLRPQNLGSGRWVASLGNSHGGTSSPPAGLPEASAPSPGGAELWNGSATPGTRTDRGPGARLMSGALHGDAQRRGGVCLPVNPLIFPGSGQISVGMGLNAEEVTLVTSQVCSCSPSVSASLSLSLFLSLPLSLSLLPPSICLSVSPLSLLLSPLPLGAQRPWREEATAQRLPPDGAPASSRPAEELCGRSRDPLSSPSRALKSASWAGPHCPVHLLSFSGV